MTTNIKTRIFVTAQFVGFHCWSDAPAKVDFLRHLHRHVFHVKLWLNVTHDDRQLEFFLVKEQLEIAIRSLQGTLTLEPRLSCEMMGLTLARSMYEQNPAMGEAIVQIEVNEDGENGAILTWYAGSSEQSPISTPFLPGSKI